MNESQKRDRSSRIAVCAAAVFLGLASIQCYHPTVRGAAFGTAAGAIIGHQFGHKGRGAAIGGVTGAVIGNSRAYRSGYYRRPYYW